MCKCLFGIFSKTFLIILNVIFAIGGAIMLVIGSIAQSNTQILLTVLRIVPGVRSFIITMETNGTVDLINNMAIGLITIGAILFIVGFAGCCGASCSCTLCLVPYAIFVIILIACQVGIIVFAALDPSMFKERVEKAMYKNLEFYSGTGMNFNPKNNSMMFGNTGWTFSWDYMQVEAKCCGSYGFDDWQTANTTKWNNTYTICQANHCQQVSGAIVPLSCCKFSNPDYYPERVNEMKISISDATSCLKQASEDYTNLKGCYAGIEHVIRKYSIIVIIVTGVIILIQVLAVICACFLSRAK